MIYEFLLGVGLIGTITQAFMGAAGGRHGARGQRGVRAQRGAKGTRGARGTRGAQRASGSAALEAVLGVLSPLRLFAISLGAGATGMLCRPFVLSPLWLAGLALLGGVLFYALIVGPLLSVALRFASEPAQTLNDSVAKECEAKSRFDARGQGIVTLTIDGRLTRLLAHLDAPAEVCPGDKLVVLSVDAQHNTCRVTRL
ncbi:MAG: hypothetical protein QM758_17940 [Armatimonas sp.]